jgi:hypothetical protein
VIYPLTTISHWLRTSGQEKEEKHRCLQQDTVGIPVHISEIENAPNSETFECYNTEGENCISDIMPRNESKSKPPSCYVLKVYINKNEI